LSISASSRKNDKKERDSCSSDTEDVSGSQRQTSSVLSPVRILAITKGRTKLSSPKRWLAKTPPRRGPKANPNPNATPIHEYLLPLCEWSLISAMQAFATAKLATENPMRPLARAIPSNEPCHTLKAAQSHEIDPKERHEMIIGRRPIRSDKFPTRGETSMDTIGVTEIKTPTHIPRIA
jgi:hypothetical protein